MRKFDKQVYFGIVEDINDPRRMGRVKIRVQNVFDDIALEDIPWASFLIYVDGKTFQIPPVGKEVSVYFDDGDIYHPLYDYTDQFNINLKDKLESLSDDDYGQFIAMMFDHKLRIYTDSDNYTMDYLVNRIRMKNDSINISIKDNDRKITLGSESADQRAVLGDHFVMEWFKEFLNILIQPTSLTGNNGAPVLKPQLDAHVQLFLNNPEMFVSKNVFISDNNKIDKIERDTATSSVEHDDTTFVTPIQENVTNGAGINLEKSPEVSQQTRDKIQDNQNRESQIIKDSQAKNPDGSVSLPSTTSSPGVTNSNLVSTNSIDSYSKTKQDNKVKSGSASSKYSVDRRGRYDELSSQAVIDRTKGDSQSVSNPNYGQYNKS